MRARVVPTGTVVSIATVVPARRPRADGGDDRVEGAPSRAARRRRRRAAAPPRRGPGPRPRRPSCPASRAGARRRTASPSASSRPSSPGNGASPRLTRSTTRGSMSQPVTSWPGGRELRRERQADLAEARRRRTLSSRAIAPRTRLAAPGAVEHGLGAADGLQPLLERDDRRVRVAGQEVAERLELGQQRLAARRARSASRRPRSPRAGPARWTTRRSRCRCGRASGRP